MKKIPSLFVRDYENHTHLATNERNKGRFLATQQATPGCEWVLAGEGVATRKWDGTAVMVKDGIMYKRYDAKHGKTPPEGFIPCQYPDPVTGHWPGWLKTDLGSNADKWLLEAYMNYIGGESERVPEDGTYEAIGPKINGGHDRHGIHNLMKHGKVHLYTNETNVRTFQSVKDSLELFLIEGIVYHHPDGRMCKVKRSDFGLKWPI